MKIDIVLSGGLGDVLFALGACHDIARFHAEDEVRIIAPLFEDSLLRKDPAFGRIAIFQAHVPLRRTYLGLYAFLSSFSKAHRALFQEGRQHHRKRKEGEERERQQIASIVEDPDFVPDLVYNLAIHKWYDCTRKHYLPMIRKRNPSVVVKGVDADDPEDRFPQEFLCNKFQAPLPFVKRKLLQLFRSVTRRWLHINNIPMFVTQVGLFQVFFFMLQKLGIPAHEALNPDFSHLVCERDERIASLPKPFVFLIANASSAKKIWSHFGELALVLLERGYHLVTTGGFENLLPQRFKKDRRRGSLGDVHVFKSKDGSPASMQEIAMLVAHCAFFVGLDTGMAHLACLMDKEGVVLYGKKVFPAWFTATAHSRALFAQKNWVEDLSLEEVMGLVDRVERTIAQKETKQEANG